MSEIRSKIQHNISIYRKKAGLTQDELAEKLHVKKTSLASWEQGKSLPDIDTLFTLCDILQVNISVISGFEPQQSQHHLGDGVQHAINEFYQAVDSISEYSARVGTKTRHLYLMTKTSSSTTTANSTMRVKKRSATMSQTLQITQNIKNVVNLSWRNKHK